MNEINIKKIKSEANSNPLSENSIEEIIEEVNKSFPDGYSYVLDKINEIIIGNKKKNELENIIENIDFLNELRVFDSEKEIKIFKRMDKLYMRKRKDDNLNTDSEEIYYFDSIQLERKSKKNISIRSYIKFNEIYLATIYDNRIISINGGENDGR